MNDHADTLRARLPELPKPHGFWPTDGERVFNIDQMHDYALAAIAALAHQRPAPSVSDDPFFGPLERRAVVFPPKPAPVSEPAASGDGLPREVREARQAYEVALRDCSPNANGPEAAIWNAAASANRAIDAMIRRLATTGQPPRINIRCETREDGGWVGTTILNVVRVEPEDDGSFTAVTDHWPQQPPPVEVAEELAAVRAALFMFTHAIEQVGTWYGNPDLEEADVAARAVLGLPAVY